MLQFWKDKRRHMLVCMSACSNVTGIIFDVVLCYSFGKINVIIRGGIKKFVHITF